MEAAAARLLWHTVYCCGGSRTAVTSVHRSCGLCRGIVCHVQVLSPAQPQSLHRTHLTMPVCLPASLIPLSDSAHLGFAARLAHWGSRHRLPTTQRPSSGCRGGRLHSRRTGSGRSSRCSRPAASGTGASDSVDAAAGRRGWRTGGGSCCTAKCRTSGRTSFSRQHGARRGGGSKGDGPDSSPSSPSGSVFCCGGSAGRRSQPCEPGSGGRCPSLAGCSHSSRAIPASRGAAAATPLSDLVPSARASCRFCANRSAPAAAAAGAAAAGGTSSGSGRASQRC